MFKNFHDIEEPNRGGTRGGHDLFSWDKVKIDKDRENYLGHSVMAPVGRSQGGPDFLWYTKDKSDPSKTSVKNEDPKSEKKQIIDMEKQAMMKALGINNSYFLKNTNKAVDNSCDADEEPWVEKGIEIEVNPNNESQEQDINATKPVKKYTVKGRSPAKSIKKRYKSSSDDLSVEKHKQSKDSKYKSKGQQKHKISDRKRHKDDRYERIEKKEKRKTEKTKSRRRSVSSEDSDFRKSSNRKRSTKYSRFSDKRH